MNNRFYLAAWRWHFYAGLFVIPFLLVLAATGILMLASHPIDRIQNAHRLQVEPLGTFLPPVAQVAAATSAHPHAIAATYIPPRDAGSSAQVLVVPAHGTSGHSDHSPQSALTVYVDPYRGTVLGSEDPQRTLYGWASVVHGTLLMGQFGDMLIEVAAGLGILLVVTGLFLWWPRGGQKAVVVPRPPRRRRQSWRDLHASLGLWLSTGLLFFLLSGLAWTPVWGGRMVQGFSSLPPATMQSEDGGGGPTHESLNHGAHRQVPWVLEQTPMPRSGEPLGLAGVPEGVPVDLDSVVAFARASGYTGYRVNLPRDPSGVWTIAAATMSRDISDPRQDRTMHIDQYSGRVLADYRFDDYPILGKAMAAGISIHQGNVTPVNLLANLLFCLGVVALSGSAVVAWWLRRPAGVAGKLVPPPVPQDARAWRQAALLMLGLSIAFPLAALALLAVGALDLLLVSRVPALRDALK